MKAILQRALVAPAIILCCLTFWAAAARAADALPSTISQLRTAQFSGVNTIEAMIYRWPHDYYAVVIEQPVARTNVSVSGLTPEALTNKLREVAFQMASLATNYPSASPKNATTNSEFQLVATAKEADIVRSIFPEDDAPKTTLEMAQVNVVFPLVTNGNGGFRLPIEATAETIPINVSEYVFLPFPNLKYFDGTPPPWYFQQNYERKTYARIFTGETNGTVSEVQSKAFGNATFDQISSDRYTKYLYADDMKLLRLYPIGRIGIHLSLITNGIPAVLALEAADGTFPKYWLLNGQPIGAPVLTSIGLASGAPKLGMVGLPNRRVVLESATTIGATATWTVVATFSLPDQHGMTNYACPMSIGPGMGPHRFLRLREE